MHAALTRLFRIFGSRNDRELRRMAPIVRAINAREPALEQKSDADLRAETDRLRARLAGGETLDDILPDAFALVREMSRRTPPPGAAKGLRHFDVQLLGGIVLHQGKIAEMVTGEGKTLVATSPAYLNALAGKGVHVVTVNDYLARRDREWMGPIYERLGLTVGVIEADMDHVKRRVAYDSDITYGTNNEFGFDYLRDNMRGSLEEQVQRRSYAILDEVDNILIDEARTPLIISGMAEGDTRRYYAADRVVRRLEKDKHFEIKEKESQAILTEEGIIEAQRLVGVDSFYTGANLEWPHLLEQALRAHHLFHLDHEYVVAEEEDGKRGVIIVDEFTGRLMHGRRWSDGLHQAVEAKEGIVIRAESQTLATITFQNFFKLYDKLAGMTGTALTEAGEFLKIYGLDVMVVPTHMPLVRQDTNDKVYATEKEKFTAVVDDILAMHAIGRPVLVGTTSIEKSERLSEVLKRRGIEHEVLNAKHHAREAEIIAKAGQRGHVTIATNMAGRGTDIKLGPGIAELGGLHVLGTERHEARRIDNQLRGRSGRQGDPGSTRFYLSFDDDLMRKFASPTVKGLLQKLGLKDGESIEHRWVTRSVERAQKKVEERNFEIRKRLLEYDEVMNEQRTLIYDYRQQILRNEGLRELVERMFSEVVDLVLEKELAEGKDDPEAREAAQRNVQDWLKRKIGREVPGLPADEEQAKAAILEAVKKRYDEREADLGAETMRRVERFILLDAFDSKWKDHLHNMDALKSGIGLRGYASEDPKVAYKREGYGLFEEMLRTIQEQVTDYVLRIEIAREGEEDLRRKNIWGGGREIKEAAPGLGESRDAMDAAANRSQSQEKPKPFKRNVPKVGRNDPCPCGSGQKYKKCHGAEATGVPE
jgi:preprotein translocase subunit SecA